MADVNRLRDLPHLVAAAPVDQHASPGLLDAAFGLRGAALRALGAPVEFDHDQFPEGVNIEVVTAPRADGAITMRVHERGVGETRSCGTGTVAAAAAALAHRGEQTGTLRVRIPGGEVSVEVSDSTSFLRGPAVLVARGELADAWWAAQL